MPCIFSIEARIITSKYAVIQWYCRVRLLTTTVYVVQYLFDWYNLISTGFVTISLFISNISVSFTSRYFFGWTSTYGPLIIIYGGFKCSAWTSMTSGIINLNFQRWLCVSKRYKRVLVVHRIMESRTLDIQNSYLIPSESVPVWTYCDIFKWN